MEIRLSSFMPTSRPYLENTLPVTLSIELFLSLIRLSVTATFEAEGEAQQTALPERDRRHHAPTTNGECALNQNKHLRLNPRPIFYITLTSDYPDTR
jgi:hypothetical protein